jgi:hypothetical protein
MTTPLTASSEVGARIRSQAHRKPVRISITICHSTYAELELKSTDMGRSISNLAAYLIESSLESLSPQPDKRSVIQFSDRNALTRS